MWQAVATYQLLLHLWEPVYQGGHIDIVRLELDANHVSCQRHRSPKSGCGDVVSKANILRREGE